MSKTPRSPERIAKVLNFLYFKKLNRKMLGYISLRLSLNWLFTTIALKLVAEFQQAKKKAPNCSGAFASKE